MRESHEDETAAEKTARCYGLWDSPLSPRSLAAWTRLEAARWDSDGRTLVWLEDRSGQGVLVAQRSAVEAPVDLTCDRGVRAEVSYGGGDFAVHRGHVYFVAHNDGRVFRQPLRGGQVRAITPKFGKAASPAVSPDGRWVAYVHQDNDAIDRLAVVDAEGRAWSRILTEGHDFYMQPRWSPDGKRFTWIAWDHPNMPWDGTVLYAASVAGDRFPKLVDVRKIAGGPETAVFQPEFTPDGRRVLFVSDETGWGRIGLCDLDTAERRWLTPEGLEYGLPAWLQDMRTYGLAPDGRQLLAACNEGGFQRIERIDLETAERAPVAELSDYTEVSQVAVAPAGRRVAFVGSGPAIPPRVVDHDLQSGRTRVVARSRSETVPAAALARCEALTWETDGGQRAHGLYYAPASARFRGTGKPPLVVLVHGGPTSQARAGWNADAQFLATRGYAVLVVNYRGSTGYGREYMLKLRGRWGECDVDDCISGARHLAESGKADPGRTVIMGGSAGGFTVLEAMVRRPDAFAAGICLYGVADQFHLAAETHKFESRYLDTLLGPLPEAAPIYRDRSPVLRAGRIRRPLAVFQGDEDQIVPRAQSEAIVAALKQNGTPHVYHVYQGEGHGWRKRETVEHFYKAVDRFLREHVVFA